MKHNIQAALAATLCLTALACSSTRKYEMKGDPNFSVTLKSGGAFLKSTSLEFSVFEYLSNCKIRYLGTRELSRGETLKIALPVNRPVGVRTMFEQGGFFSNTHYSNLDAAPFTFLVKPKGDYELIVEEEDGAIGRNFYVTTAGKRVELEPAKFFPDCMTWQDE